MLDNLVWLALALSVISWYIRFLPAYLASSALWAAYTTYVFIVMPTPVDASTTSGGFLLGGLLLMIFVPLLLSMRTSIYQEKTLRKIKGRGGMLQGEYTEVRKTEQTSWLWQKPPGPTTLERQTEYRNKLKIGRK